MNEIAIQSKKNPKYKKHLPISYAIFHAYHTNPQHITFSCSHYTTISSHNISNIFLLTPNTSSHSHLLIHIFSHTSSHIHHTPITHDTFSCFHYTSSSHSHLLIHIFSFTSSHSHLLTHIITHTS